jgi:hypothetical protein
MIWFPLGSIMEARGLEPGCSLQLPKRSVRRRVAQASALNRNINSDVLTYVYLFQHMQHAPHQQFQNTVTSSTHLRANKSPKQRVRVGTTSRNAINPAQSFPQREKVRRRRLLLYTTAISASMRGSDGHSSDIGGSAPTSRVIDVQFHSSVSGGWGEGGGGGRGVGVMCGVWGQRRGDGGGGGGVWRVCHCSTCTRWLQ